MEWDGSTQLFSSCGFLGLLSKPTTCDAPHDTFYCQGLPAWFGIGQPVTCPTRRPADATPDVVLDATPELDADAMRQLAEAIPGLFNDSDLTLLVGPDTQPPDIGLLTLVCPEVANVAPVQNDFPWCATIDPAACARENGAYTGSMGAYYMERCPDRCGYPAGCPRQGEGTSES